METEIATSIPSGIRRKESIWVENPFAAKRRKFWRVRSSTFYTNTILYNTTTFHLASKSQILLDTNRKKNSLYIFPPSQLKKIHRYSNRPPKDTRDTRMDIALTSGFADWRWEVELGGAKSGEDHGRWRARLSVLPGEGKLKQLTAFVEGGNKRRRGPVSKRDNRRTDGVEICAARRKRRGGEERFNQTNAYKWVVSG